MKVPGIVGRAVDAVLAPCEPLEAIVMVTCLDGDGEVRWALRATGGLNSEELLGALVLRTDLLRKDLLDAFDD